MLYAVLNVCNVYLIIIISHVDPFHFSTVMANICQTRGFACADPVTNWQLSYEMKHNHLAYDWLDTCLISHGMAPIVPTP